MCRMPNRKGQLSLLVLEEKIHKLEYLLTLQIVEGECERVSLHLCMGESMELWSLSLLSFDVFALELIVNLFQTRLIVGGPKLLLIELAHLPQVSELVHYFLEMTAALAGRAGDQELR
jgi:hypothetical protein